MKNIKQILLQTLLGFIFSQAIFSQAFIDKGYHPRNKALGNSVLALTEDVSLLFYNPASISFGTTTQVFAGFTNLYPTITDDNLNVLNAGAKYSLSEIGTIGVGVSQFSPNFWSERTIFLSFASHLLYDNLSIGGSAKILSWSAESPQGEYAVPEPALSFTGMSFDVGVIYLIPELFEQNDLQIGLTWYDITQPSIAHSGNSSASLPLRIAGGAAYISHKHNYKILGGVSLNESDVRLSLGYEISALKVTTYGVESEFFVRVGGGRVANNDSQGEYNGGFGLTVENLTIDYSYSFQAYIRNVGGISSVAISYEF